MEEKNNIEIVEENNLKNSLNEKPKEKGNALQKWSKALFIISIIGVCLSLFCAFSAILPALYFIGLILVVVITLGTIFAIDPNFGSWFTKGADISATVVPFLMGIFPIVASVVLALNIASLILLLSNKQKRSWVKIIFTIFFIILLAVLLILSLLSKL